MTSLEMAPESMVRPGAPDWQALVDELEGFCETDPRQCVERSAMVLDLAHARGEDDAEMRLSYFAAVAHQLLAHDTAALAAAARTEELAVAQGDVVWRARALTCRALVHRDIGEPEDAVDLLGRALDLCREAKDDAGTASVLNNLGAVYTGMVQFAPQAAQVLSEARRIWLASGELDLASMALTNLAKTYVVTSERLAQTNPRGGRAAARRALDIAKQAVEDADAVGLGRSCIDARLVVVGALMAADDLAATAGALDSTRSMLNRFPMSRQELEYRVVRGSWLVRTGQLDVAVSELLDGLELCNELGRPRERIELLRSLVEAYEGQGDLAAALRALHDVFDLTVQQGEVVAERRALLLASRLDVERAQRIAEGALLRASALELYNSRLEHEATHDALTGIVNRRSLDGTLASWSAGRPAGFACALLDVDHFKRVNDGWSHQAGDRVLARLAAVLSHAVRSDDVAARYGGEEFALLLGGADPAAAMQTCERIRIAVATTDWDDLIPGGRITVSIGLSLHRDQDTVDELLRRADGALYEAKNAGRNAVRLAGDG